MKILKGFLLEVVLFQGNLFCKVLGAYVWLNLFLLVLCVTSLVLRILELMNK